MSVSEVQLKNEVARAGAGAGKTTLLVQRVVDTFRSFQAHAQSTPRMVVTTFTRKATQELRDRLVVHAVSGQVDVNLLKFVSSKSHLHISTIHGVLSLFLRRYGQVAGLDPQFSVLGEDEGAKLRRRIMREVLMHNPGFEEFLEHHSFDELVALCGSLGTAKKVFPDLRRAEESEFSGALKGQAEQHAAIWQEIQASILEETTSQKFVELAEAAGGLVNHLRGQPLDSSWWLGLMERVEGLPRTANRGKEKPISDSLNEMISEAKKKLKKWLERDEISPALWPKFFARAEGIESLADQFSKRLDELKRELGQLEMNDLETESWLIIQQYPALAEAFSLEWDFWLIDEFQDTSPLQFRLIEALAGDRSKFVVGDPQQSIYLFRGARSEVFAQGEAKILAQGGVPTELFKNYRSRPELLTFFNDFFTQLGPQFATMEPREPAVESESPPVVARFYHSPEPGRQQEMQEVSAQLKELAQDPQFRLSDVFVLGRTNDQLSEVAKYLKTLGWPTHLHVASGFHQRREILDALGLLRFMVNPHDDQNLVMILRSPWCKVDDSQIVSLAGQRQRGHSLWQTAVSAPEWRDQYVFRELARLREVAASLGYAHALIEGLRTLGVFDFSRHYDATGRRESNLWKLVHELKSKERAPGFQVLEFTRKAFQVGQNGEGVQEGDASAVLEPDCINLMTVHAAKGLKCKYLFLPFCHESPMLTDRSERLTIDEVTQTWSVRIPCEREAGEDSERMWWTSVHGDAVIEHWRKAEVDEHQRLLYVALTRAQKNVFLSWSGSPQRNSWAQMWRWPVGEPGVFSRSVYAFEVVEGEARDAQSWAGKDKSHMSIPSKWSVSDLLRSGGTSVTELVGDQLFQQGVLKKFLTRRAEKVSEGVALHRIFELLRHHREEDVVVQYAAPLGMAAGELTSMTSWLLSQMNPPLATLIQQGEVEWGFQTMGPRGLVEGQIDLWGEHEGAVWVVDYKTGSPDFEEQAVRQLNIYAWALEKKLKSKLFNLAVVYPRSRQIKIHSYVGGAQVEEWLSGNSQ